MAALTLQQFLKKKETKPASEFACGKVFQKPMPDVPHAAIQTFLAALFFTFLAQAKSGRAFTELRCIFGPPGQERTYVPDVTYVAREHLPPDRHLHRPPDLAIEILSPDHHLAQFMDKIQFYLSNGVRLVWVIDPARSTITEQGPGTETRILQSGDLLDGGEVLPGFKVAVADIFAQMVM